MRRCSNQTRKSNDVRVHHCYWIEVIGFSTFSSDHENNNQTGSLYNTLFFYIVIICISVFWIIGTITYTYSYKNNPIAHKYLNHGRNVPFQKCFKSNIFM